MQERHDVTVELWHLFSTLVTLSSLPAQAGARELLLQNARESEESGAKANPNSFKRCWKLRTVVSSKRDKNCSFLFKGIIILCFNGNKILLDQISKLLKIIKN